MNWKNMEKSSEKSDKYIDQKAYIRYLRKVTGEQIDIEKIRREIMKEILNGK